MSVMVLVKPLTGEAGLTTQQPSLNAARLFAAGELAEWLEASMDAQNGATREACSGEMTARIAQMYAEAILDALRWDGMAPVEIEAGFGEVVRLGMTADEVEVVDEFVYALNTPRLEAEAERLGLTAEQLLDRIVIEAKARIG